MLPNAAAAGPSAKFRREIASIVIVVSFDRRTDRQIHVHVRLSASHSRSSVSGTATMRGWPTPLARRYPFRAQHYDGRRSRQSALRHLHATDTPPAWLLPP